MSIILVESQLSDLQNKLTLINSIEWSKKYSLENLHEDQVSSKIQKTYHSSVDISVLKNLDIMIDLVDLEPPPMVNLGAPKQMERQQRKLIKKWLQLRKSSRSKKISMKIQPHHRTREPSGTRETIWKISPSKRRKTKKPYFHTWHIWYTSKHLDQRREIEAQETEPCLTRLITQLSSLSYTTDPASSNKTAP